MGIVSKVSSVAPIGFDGHLVEVESDISNGLPALSIVGLGSKAIDEAKDRVRSAVTNSLLTFPSKKITVNLAPAQLPKDGTLYDLPIALAILSSSGQIQPHELKKSVFAGELALDGSIRAIPGAVTIAETAKINGYENIYLPADNATQAALIKGINVFGINSLKELFLHLKGELKLSPAQLNPALDSTSPIDSSSITLDDIFGQEQAKRALIIAASGHHNILFTGTPGAGKTMLAKALRTLLPKLTDDEKLEVTKIHSLGGTKINDIVHERPFRSPHHTSSQIALVGGGTKPKPGEISLANLGVLFLDEIPEFPRSVLEALRQPLEDHQVTVSRVNAQATYPANFMLVATMNPCPCGYYGDPEKACSCSMTQIVAYQKKLSGPLLDRIDMIIPISRIPHAQLLVDKSLTKSQQDKALELIYHARLLQSNRYGSSKKLNSSLSNSEIKTYAKLEPQTKLFLDSAADKLKLSARSYFKVIKLARTIADLDKENQITSQHIAEAIQYCRTP